MVGGRYACNDAVDSADFDPRTGAFRVVGEHGTGGMSTSEDKESTGCACGCKFSRILSAFREEQTLIYQYQVERVSRRALEGHAAALGRRTCSNQQLFNLMSIGGAVRYSYELRESGQRVVHEITLQQCNTAIAL